MLSNSTRVYWKTWRVFVRHICKNVNTMQRLAVRSVPGEERLQIRFKFATPENGKERIYNLDRLKEEQLQNTLARISANVGKVVHKKKSKKRKEDADLPEEEVCVKLYHSKECDIEFSGEAINGESWVEGAVLQIQEVKYAVQVNVPTVRSITLPGCVMAGFPVYPKLDAEFADFSRSQIIWSTGRETRKSVKAQTSAKQNKKLKTKFDGSDLEWTEVHRGRYYVPTNGDVNLYLKVECVPTDGTRLGEAENNTNKVVEVHAGPGFCPFQNRHQYTRTVTPHGSLRMMTYNILADLYADSDYSREVLYPYCPPYALRLDYRKQLLLKEILGYNADVVCLQEVDRKLFIHDLLSIFEQEGLKGLMKTKPGEVAEGCATFFREEKLQLVASHDLDMMEALAQEPVYQDLYEKVSQNDLLKEKVMQRKSTIQTTVLQSKEDPRQRVIVATCHFYFHPRADNIRLIQAIITLRHVQHILEQYKAQDNTPAVIICGDLNSAPLSGVIQLLTHNHVASNHRDWYSGGSLEHVDNIELSHPLQLSNACGALPFTNMVSAFHGCLDYIFVDREQFEVTKTVPMSSLDEINPYTALPNAVFPSDHLPLICDLKWAPISQH